MNWTTRIHELVGKDFYIHKDNGEVKDFIDYLYRPYKEGDQDIDTMEERGDRKMFDLYKRVLYNIAVYTHAEKVVECGIREARSSDAFTRAVSKENGRVISFDPMFVPRVFVKDPYKQYWEPHEVTGEEGYKIFGTLVNNIDLLYIDVDPHYYNPTHSLLEGYWSKNVRKGGYIVLDDAAPQFDESVASIEYEGVWRPVRDYGVLRAILEFLDANDQRVDYCFTVFNNQANGFAIIKLGE
jgi:hypothetical protein